MTVPQDKRKEGRLVVLVKALEVANYTNGILANKKKFPAELDEVLGNDIKKHGQAIYRNCKLANDLRVQKPVTGIIDEEAKEARYRLQTNAIQACTELLIDIDMAYGTYHLPAKRVAHWGKMTKEARDYIRKWRDADKKRYDSSQRRMQAIKQLEVELAGLRSANYGNANNEFNGNSDGSLNNNNANNTYRLLPDRILRHQQMPVTQYKALDYWYDTRSRSPVVQDINVLNTNNRAATRLAYEPVSL